MRRREFVALISGAAVIRTRAGAAQQRPVPVIGILGFGHPDNPEVKMNLAGFRQGLAEGGFVEGKNVAIEYRWAEGDEARLPGLAAELVARRVDVIVNEGGLPTVRAAKAATKTIPVVFHTADAIADGIVGHLARPDANLTGVSMFAPEMLAKEFQLLLEMVPQARIVAALAIPKNIVGSADFRQLEETARTKGVRVEVFSADTASDLDKVYASLGRQRIEGLVVRANVIYGDQLIGLATRYPVPAVYNQRAFAERGALLSYAPSFPAVYVTKGRYAARLLKGAKPVDLPVAQPTTFELVINLKTAKALGLTIPPTLLAQADEVLE